MKPASNGISFTSKSFSWKDGKHWFNEGIELFKHVKNHWYLSCLLMGVLLLLTATVSATLVMILVVFLSPVVTAFMMNCCHHVRSSKPLTFSVLWQAVFRELNYFLLLGLVSALLTLVMQQIHLQLMVAYNLPLELTEEMMQNMSGREALLRVLFNLLTNIPVALALAFSPALILFKKTHPFHAIQYSIKGFLKSWKAFVSMVMLIVLVFFGAMILASFFASVFMAVLGTASEFMINVLVLFFAFTITGIGLCCQYQAYTELFDQDNEEDEENGTEVYAEI